ncbi:MAG: N-acetylglucosamine kinase [Candidatus Korobacteraceae bacterium]
MAIFLGIDGGGTTTTCVAGDERRVLGVGRAGGSNLVRLGEAVAREHLQQAFREALAAAGVEPVQVQSLCAGVAGAATPGVGAAVRKILADATGLSVERVRVVGDMEVALEDSCSGQPGIVVIAGTGSVGYGRNVHGRTARAGGWGWAISDEGSGHWIGRRAVAEVMRAHDNGEHPALADAVLHAWQASALPEIVRMANACPVPDYPGLFPVVLAAAELGDALAVSILKKAGSQLAGLGATVLRRLWDPVEQARVTLGGSVFRHAPQVRHAFFAELRRQHPRVAVSFRIADAANGALSMAREMTRKMSAREAAQI